MSILAINTGSTSLKFCLFDPTASETLLAGNIDWAGGDKNQAKLSVQARGQSEVQSRLPVPDESAAAQCAIRTALSFFSGAGPAAPITVVGHRVVHGGAEFRESVRIDGQVKAAIARLGQLAPLHNPPALKAIEAAEAALPEVPQVAVFDTAFFATLPPKAYIYGLPYRWYQEWGIRRFGFHGLSHAYCTGRAAELLERPPAELRMVTCHLGGGCSATAVRGGTAVATTMGFTPLEGLLMGTRCGSVDPGILLYVQRQHGVTVEELEHALTYGSGLLGVSGLTPNLAKIEAAMAQGNERARLAFDVFADRARSAVGALTVGMGGLDALVFSGRAGEKSPVLRAAVCQGLECVGVRLDPERNLHAQPDSDLATVDSPARVLVIRTQEELMIAREARRVVE